MPQVRISFCEATQAVKYTQQGFGSAWKGFEVGLSGFSSGVSREQFLDGLGKGVLDKVTEVQVQDLVQPQLLEQARVFKEKANKLNSKGICPPVGNILKFTNVKISENYWPQEYEFDVRGHKISTSVHISKLFLKKFGFIYGVEVTDANSLPQPGCWRLSYEGEGDVLKQVSVSCPYLCGTEVDLNWVNIVNGYYVDWSLYSWDIGTLFRGVSV